MWSIPFCVRVKQNALFWSHSDENTRNLMTFEKTVSKMFQFELFKLNCRPVPVRNRDQQKSINQSKALISVGQNVTDYSVRGKIKTVRISGANQGRRQELTERCSYFSFLPSLPLLSFLRSPPLSPLSLASVPIPFYSLHSLSLPYLFCSLPSFPVPFPPLPLEVSPLN